MLEEGIEMGIRIGELPDSSMCAIKVGGVRLICVAPPSYLKKFDEPNSPKSLSQHSTITPSTANNFIGWQFQSSNQPQSFKISPRLITSTNDAAIKVAPEGFGITRVLSYQVDPYLAAGALKHIYQKF